jgi:hypothetical protein
VQKKDFKNILYLQVTMQFGNMTCKTSASLMKVFRQALATLLQVFAGVLGM